MKKHKKKNAVIKTAAKETDSKRFFSDNDLQNSRQKLNAAEYCMDGDEDVSKGESAVTDTTIFETEPERASGADGKIKAGEKNKTELPALLFICINTFLLILVTVAAIIIHRNVFTLELALNGESEITLEYGENYEEKGTVASFYGTLLVKKPKTPKVTVSGKVNTDTVGTYTLNYDAEYILDYLVGEKIYKNSIQRTVHVVDTVSPVIDLVYDPDAFTVPGQAYSEDGFTAFDNYDGDLTSKVISKEEAGKVYYTVSDSSGNTTDAEREIFYHDPYPPEITLLGDSAVTITEGDSFTDPGYTAIDNVDGDISANVTVTGEVNTQIAGTYTLTYTVADSYSNSAEAVRTVTVEAYVPPVVMPQGQYGTPQNPNGKVIYLTFDDGPGKHTSRLLDILDKYGVKATFFVVNTEYLYLLPRMAASGHTVAMHAAVHDYKKVYASDDAYFYDLYTMQGLISEKIGFAPTILRFPGGSSNVVSRISPGIMTRLTAKVKEMGYRYFDWNVDSCDAGGTKTSWGVYNNVVSKVPKFEYSVVLQHDIHGYSVDAVESIIVWGLENGYTFLPLTNDSPVCEHTVKN